LPLPVCDHSQGVYLFPNRDTGGGVQFFGVYSNKQTNKQKKKNRGLAIRLVQ